MKPLAPYRGTLFRLALTNALLAGLVAMAILTLRNMSQSRVARESITVDSGRHVLGSARTATIDAPSEADQDFIRAAAELVWEEIRVAEVSARRASDAQVRGFAQELAAQRRAARNEIEALAAQKGVLLPTSELASPGADRVAAARGEKFDASFVEWAKAKESAALKLFEQAVDECSDPQLRDFAARMVPRLRAQYDHARRLQRAVY